MLKVMNYLWYKMDKLVPKIMDNFYTYTSFVLILLGQQFGSHVCQNTCCLRNQARNVHVYTCTCIREFFYQMHRKYLVWNFFRDDEMLFKIGQFLLHFENNLNCFQLKLDVNISFAEISTHNVKPWELRWSF